MTAPQEPLKLTPEAFEETARVITYQWMQHVGHGYEDVERIEQMLDADVPVDEGDPNHDHLREFADTTSLVVFVMEQLVSLAEFTATERRRARDDAAELRAAVEMWVDATDILEHDRSVALLNGHRDPEYIRADIAYIKRADARLRAALAATEGSE